MGDDKLSVKIVGPEMELCILNFCDFENHLKDQHETAMTRLEPPERFNPKPTWTIIIY